jgi:hypothetical protein
MTADGRPALSTLRHSVMAAVSGFAVSASVAYAADPYAQFRLENAAAMREMMAGMAAKPSGGVDRDFAAIMIAHHPGAIDMAEAELRHGANEQLRRIAQEIIVDQQQEIAAMRLAIGDPLPPSTASPTQPSQRPSSSINPEPPR